MQLSLRESENEDLRKKLLAYSEKVDCTFYNFNKKWFNFSFFQKKKMITKGKKKWRKKERRGRGGRGGGRGGRGRRRGRRGRRGGGRRKWSRIEYCTNSKISTSTDRIERSS